MRKVIKQNENVCVDVNTADADKYYAAYRADIEAVGFVTQEEHREGNYRFFAPTGITHGNGWSSFINKFLSDHLSQLINNGFEVYEFDTAREMFAFVLSKTRAE